MSAEDPQGSCQVVVQFRSDNERDIPELGRAGWTALEQAEMELEKSGIAVSLEPSGADGGDGMRGFGLGDVLVNVIANAITALLFRAAIDLLRRWQKLQRQRAHSARSSDANEAPKIILQAGRQQIVVDAETPEDEMYQQLALWAPNVIEAGTVTFQIVDNQP